jgi:hypothetical protein
VSVQRSLWLLHPAAPGDQGILWSGSCPTICRPRSPARRRSRSEAIACGSSVTSSRSLLAQQRRVRLVWYLTPLHNRKASDRKIGPAYPARRASGSGNWDQPRHTTCRGRPICENPTYSAFWSVFGVTCLRLQRLPASVGFREDGAIGAQEEPAGFRRKLRAWRVLRYSCPVDRGDPREDILLIGTTKGAKS